MSSFFLSSDVVCIFMRKNDIRWFWQANSFHERYYCFENFSGFHLVLFAFFVFLFFFCCFFLVLYISIRKCLLSLWLWLVCANDIAYDGTAQRAMATADSLPLFQCTFVAHAHVSAHVQHRIDGMLVADSALYAGCQIGGILVLPLCQWVVRLRRRFHRLCLLSDRRNSINSFIIRWKLTPKSLQSMLTST